MRVVIKYRLLLLVDGQKKNARVICRYQMGYYMGYPMMSTGGVCI